MRRRVAVLAVIASALAAAEELRFEYAARVRDEIRDLRREIAMAQANEAPA